MVALSALALFEPASYTASPHYARAYERCPYANVASAAPISTSSTLLLAELNSVMLDCYQPDWDGYGAAPITLKAYAAAKSLIENLPVGFPVPSLAPDPDGLVTFEWRTGARRIALVTVHPDFQVSYASIFGEAKSYGSEPFFGELPDTVKGLIRRVHGV